MENVICLDDSDSDELKKSVSDALKLASAFASSESEEEETLKKKKKHHEHHVKKHHKKKKKKRKRIEVIVSSGEDDDDDDEEEDGFIQLPKKRFLTKPKEVEEDEEGVTIPKKRHPLKKGRAIAQRTDWFDSMSGEENSEGGMAPKRQEVKVSNFSPLKKIRKTTLRTSASNRSPQKALCKGNSDLLISTNRHAKRIRKSAPSSTCSSPSELKRSSVTEKKKIDRKINYNDDAVVGDDEEEALVISLQVQSQLKKKKKEPNSVSSNGYDRNYGKYRDIDLQDIPLSLIQAQEQEFARIKAEKLSAKTLACSSTSRSHNKIMRKSGSGSSSYVESSFRKVEPAASSSKSSSTTVKMDDSTENKYELASKRIPHATCTWNCYKYEAVPSNILDGFPGNIISNANDDNVLFRKYRFPAKPRVEEPINELKALEGTDLCMVEKVHKFRERFLPILVQCHKNRVSHMIQENRRKIKQMLTALKKKKASKICRNILSKRDLIVTSEEEIVIQSYYCGYPEGFYNEENMSYDILTCDQQRKVVPNLILEFPVVPAPSRLTTFIGVKKSYRVEDDPILKYIPYFGDHDTTGVDVSFYERLPGEGDTHGVASFSEIDEYLLVMAVEEFGQTDSVFEAIKNAWMKNIGQPRADYLELRKRYEDALFLRHNVEEMKNLLSRTEATQVRTYLKNLLSNRPVFSSEDMKNVDINYEETLFSNYGMYPENMGLRNETNWRDLNSYYQDFFCRRCYVYDCPTHFINKECVQPYDRSDPKVPPYLNQLKSNPNRCVVVDDEEEEEERLEQEMLEEAMSENLAVNNLVVVNNTNIESEVVVEEEDTNTYQERRRSARAGTAASSKASISLTKQERRRVDTVKKNNLFIANKRKNQQKMKGELLAQYQALTDLELRPRFDPKKASVYCSKHCCKLKKLEKENEESTEIATAMASDIPTTTILALTRTDNLQQQKSHNSKWTVVENVLFMKARSIIGDIPCALAFLLGNPKITCEDVDIWLQHLTKQEKERQEKLREILSMKSTSDDSMVLDDDARTLLEKYRQIDLASHRNKGNGRKNSRKTTLSANREHLRRTLKNRGKDSKLTHEYAPCTHEGSCATATCQCMTQDNFCDKACPCPLDCANRAKGCKCSFGKCRTSQCWCYAQGRECDPDICFSCGAADLHQILEEQNANKEKGITKRQPLLQELGICSNINLLAGNFKKIGVSVSDVHGFGAYALEPIYKNDFVYEYTGSILSQEEAERRGKIYDKMTISFLFDLSEEYVVDATRKGNKIKFANHSEFQANCTAKILRVQGSNRIGIFAMQDIAVGEELLFNYGYHGESAPDWSQIRIAGESKKKSKRNNSNSSPSPSEQIADDIDETMLNEEQKKSDPNQMKDFPPSTSTSEVKSSTDVNEIVISSD